ncbi:class I SAM-dependent methyltransferase [Dehalococcoidia bacterium]|nr:class I SAM-dependent methyltransferase [Dehalococcoidia bacterium]
MGKEFENDEYRYAQYSNTSASDFLREDRVRKLIKICQNIREEREIELFLDIGCGTGELTLILGNALKAQKTFGMEISPVATEIAIKKGIHAVQLDVDSSNLPFDDDFFDVIFVGELIEHLFDPDHLLNEIYRTLKPEGFGIITTPNLASWYNRIILLLGYQPYFTTPSIKYGTAGQLFHTGEGGGEHLRVFTLRALRKLLVFHNFKIELELGCYGYTIPEGNFPMWAKFLYGLATRFFNKFPSLGDRITVVFKRGK